MGPDEDYPIEQDNVLEYTDTYDVHVIDAKEGVCVKRTVMIDLPAVAHTDDYCAREVGKMAGEATILLRRKVEDIQRSREIARKALHADTLAGQSHLPRPEDH